MVTSSWTTTQPHNHTTEPKMSDFSLSDVEKTHAQVSVYNDTEAADQENERAVRRALWK